MSANEPRKRRFDVVQSLHNSTKRNYVERVVENDKASCAEIAKQFGADYWDGDRKYGYGGYRYDGRWKPIAAALVERFSLKAGQRVLDVGCGKGYLVYELLQLVPGIEVRGLDISSYAALHAKEEVQPLVVVGNAAKLPFPDDSFDVVLSLGTLHNLAFSDCWAAVAEISRVGIGSAQYIMVESWRNEREKANLLYWQLTCQSFHPVDGWEAFYQRAGYSGDYGFIFFE